MRTLRALKTLDITLITLGTMVKDTMRAVVFKGPHKVALEDRPIPKIKEETDIIVKVIYSALCGR